MRRPHRNLYTQGGGQDHWGLWSTAYAFKPHPDSFELLRKNIEPNEYSNVHAFNIALSDFYRAMQELVPIVYG